MAVADERWANAETMSRLAAYPCFRCLSDHELWIVAVLVLCRILVANGTDEDCQVTELMNDGACVPCFSERQMWQALLAVIATWAVDNGYIDDLDALIDQAVCLNCVETKRLKGMLIAILNRGIEDGTLFPARQ